MFLLVCDLFINNNKLFLFFLLGFVLKIHLTISLEETWKKQLTDNSTTEFKNYKDTIEKLVS